VIDPSNCRSDTANFRTVAILKIIRHRRALIASAFATFDVYELKLPR